MVESRSCVQREEVYRWFSSLTSAQRAEFLCGLLDLCVPIELRFLGSCLEDLARKDYHPLRDAEIKANNPADLSGLTNITDEVVRSKLLVSLALLGSDNREAAGVLYRTLTHIDTVINNYGLALNDGRTEEQFLLLFTMASNHPAFSFHQKQVLRQKLGQIQDILQVSSGGGEAQGVGAGGDRTAVSYGQLYHHQPVSVPLASLSPIVACSIPDASTAHKPLSTCHAAHCSCWHKNQSREDCTVSGLGSGVIVGRGDQTVNQDLTPPYADLSPPPPPPPLHVPSGQSQDVARPTKNHQGKVGKAAIERVVLRGVTHKSEDGSEYVFETSWSDGFVSSVSRSQQEVMELLSKLSQVFPDEGVEKFLPHSLEPNPRCLTALPRHVLQHHSAQLFFTSARPLSPVCHPPPLPSALPPLPSSPPMAPVAPACPFTSSSSLGCMLHYRGANRAVYRVASVQPVVTAHSSVLTRSHPHLSSLPPPIPPPPPQHSPQMSSLPSPLPVPPAQGPMALKRDTPPQQHPQYQPGPQLQSPSYSPHHLQIQTSSQPTIPSQHPFYSQSTSFVHSHSQSLSYTLNAQSRAQSLTQPPSQSQTSTQEQNGILDWLRKLRLHKYYPVFKQLTMEEFLGLTEEDLNKYDLTQGAKKKLKTQLELQNREMKTEKRSCSGIARVTPSSYVGPSAHSTSTAGELRVEVDAVSHHHPVSTDGSSSSGYSSSSCSPRTPLCCDSNFDRTRDLHRRVPGPDPAGPGPEKERSCRPTAQVLPVQTDPAPSLPPSCSSHLTFGLPQSPYHPQASYPQTLLFPSSNPARILTSPRKPRPPPLCTEDRTKPLGLGLPAPNAGFGTGLGVGIGVRLETLIPGLSMDSSSVLQDSVGCRGLAAGAVGTMVETSCALTSTSNSVHHVSHPPLHFHLSSSSSSPSPSGCYSYPPASSSFPSFTSFCPATKAGSQPGSSGSGGGTGVLAMAAASSVPVAAVPGNSYYPPSPTSSPSLSTASTSLDGSNVNQVSGHTPPVCICSSCGCRGNCGAYGALPGYAAAGYLQPLSAGPSLFTLGPLLHLSPLIASSSTAGAGAASFSYPLMVPPPLYRHSPVSHDQQQSFGFYHPQGIVGNGGQKRQVGNVSCYNCGASGHRAEDCKQPPMDSAQQGTFRLRFTPHSDTKDSGD